MILCTSPQAKALGRHRSRYLRQAHFITSSKKSFPKFFPTYLPADFIFTEAIGWHQSRMLFYSRFSVRRTELLLLSNTAKGFIEYTSPPLVFTSIIALHEKHFTGPE